MKKNIICLTIACAMAIGVNNCVLANGITATPNNASVHKQQKPCNRANVQDFCRKVNV